MDGVRTVVPLKEIDEIAEIQWGPYDEHLVEDDDDFTRQYSSWWDVGMRGQEIWQLRQINPRMGLARRYPGDASVVIMLDRWQPGDDRPVGLRTYETLWEIHVQLTTEEILTVERAFNQTRQYRVTTTNTTKPYPYESEEEGDGYVMLVGKATDLYHRFLKEPYALLTQLALSEE